MISYFSVIECNLDVLSLCDIIAFNVCHHHDVVNKCHRITRCHQPRVTTARCVTERQQPYTIRINTFQTSYTTHTYSKVSLHNGLMNNIVRCVIGMKQYFCGQNLLFYHM